MTRETNGIPDVDRVFKELKNFQRDSAEYITRRMYLDDEPTRRFLLADEVGLGKTHVARGVIAKAIEHLSNEGVKRIDVVYICSNADIAKQNITKLNVTGLDDCAMPSRITLLPKTLHGIKGRPVNFVSFTPGTSFDLKSNTGRSDERVLLYWLLRGAWRLSGHGPQNVFQCGTGTDGFRKQLKNFKASGYTGKIDSELRGAFLQGMKERDENLREAEEPTLRRRFKDLAKKFHRARENSRIPVEDRRERNAVIGELRRVLAGTCIRALEPDLIILDEFQRFKHLLDGEDPASELARELFDYEDARVLLVSATPYKMYTVGHESDRDDHYVDFLRTVKFLVNDETKTAEFETLVSNYRRELYALADGHETQLHAMKSELEAKLRRIMVRTERLAVSADRDGMLVHEPSPDVRLDATDLAGYIALQSVAEALEIGDMMEYWKSAPYLLNFMDDYQFKRCFEEVRDDRFQVAQLAKDISAHNAMLLPWSRVQDYQEVAPSNARLRDLIATTVDNGAWQILWLAPSLPYYQLNGVFADKRLQHFTKRLIFSGWRVVPKALATMVSYEAERQIFKSHDETARNTIDARKQRRGLLRFAKSDGRLTGMPLLGLLYPSTSLARHFDPRRLMSTVANGDGSPTLNELIEHVRREIDVMLQGLLATHPDSGPADESWYWAAPLLLDHLDSRDENKQWWDQEELATEWSAEESEERGDATRFDDHLEEARKLLRGELFLGRPPDDLSLVLAQLAIAGPGVCALRGLSRVCGGKELLTDVRLRNAAAWITWHVRGLFNLPEAMSIIRGRNSAEPYWRRVLEYCADGCLQAVLDEYVHILQESMGLQDMPVDKAADQLAFAISDVLGMHVSNLGVDVIQVPKSTNDVKVTRRTMRARFAMRFGDDKSEEDASVQRSSTVRQAFNSPFWPFILATTSVGQEGLDFHPYCHAVVHWNLPSNPVDFEQREGRVHRYKGHAVRKNVATVHGAAANDLTHDDPWFAVFEAASAERDDEASELVPYWVYPIKDGAKIQRFVPALPLSQELDRLAAMRKSLAIYRMVFGQPRQDDLLEYLQKKMPEEEINRQLDQLRVDLAPPGRKAER